MSGKSNGTRPLVTVIINCYNGERWLREAIDSVVAQRYDNWEIVFWDNRSTDRSAAIAQGYGERVRYFLAPEQTPLGQARGLAMREARGQYIAFLDCDDVWLPDNLATQLRILESGSYALCYGGLIVIDADGRETGRASPRDARGDLFGALLRQFDIGVSNTIVRRAALVESGLDFDPAVTASEEYCLFMQLAARYPFASVSAPVAKYRVHDRALTNASIGQWAEEREYTLRLIEGALPNIRARYRAGFREAYARARYYRARLHVARRERGLAMRELAAAVPAS